MAALTIQRYMKGVMTRRVIKEQYGFEAKHTAFAVPTYTQSDQQILEARKLVMQIRASLAPGRCNGRKGDASCTAAVAPSVLAPGAGGLGERCHGRAKPPQGKG